MEGKTYKERYRELHGEEYRYPAKLNTKHRQLMFLLTSGVPLAEAAEEVGFSLITARTIASSPLFKQEMARIQTRIEDGLVEDARFNYRQRLEKEIKESIETLVELRDGAESEQVKMKSAAELLDRAGVKTADKVEGTITMEADGDVARMLEVALMEMRNRQQQQQVEERNE